MLCNVIICLDGFLLFNKYNMMSAYSILKLRQISFETSFLNFKYLQTNLDVSSEISLQVFEF